jgi:hypothetical protein
LTCRRPELQGNSLQGATLLSSHNDANTDPEGSLIRRLIPHAVWDFIKTVADYLWAFAGGTLLTGVGWVIAKVRHDVDYIGILVTFIAGFVIILLLMRLNRNPARSSESPSQNSTPETVKDKQTAIESNPDGLRIHGAFYGADGRYSDVAAVLRKAIVDGKIDLTVSNTLFGDPASEMKKVLLVWYSRGAQIRYAVQLEGNRFTIPDSPLKLTRPLDPTAAYFQSQLQGFRDFSPNDGLAFDVADANILIYHLMAGQDESERRLEHSNTEVKRLTDGVAFLQSKMTEELTKEANKTNEKDQLLRGEKAAHRETHQLLERCETDREKDAYSIGVLHSQLAALKIAGMGLDKPTSLNRRVLVRFIDSDDSGLAETIQSRFNTCASNSPWQASIDPDIRWRKNEPGRERVVIVSSDSSLASSLAAVFNTHRLLEKARVSAAAPQADEMTHDVVVTIFTEPKLRE